MVKVSIPIDPKKQEKRERDARIEGRKKVKASPTNKEIMEAINDLTELVREKR